MEYRKLQDGYHSRRLPFPSLTKYISSLPFFSPFHFLLFSPLAHLPPKRAILNPLMLSLFLTSLSNPLIPLDVLAKTRSIPSGLKGMECLEVLWEGGVDVDAIDSASGGKQDGGSTVGKGDGERKETVSKGGPGGGRLEQLEKKGGERPGHTRTRRMERAGWLIGVIGGHEVVSSCHCARTFHGSAEVALITRIVFVSKRYEINFFLRHIKIHYRPSPHRNFTPLNLPQLLFLGW